MPRFWPRTKRHSKGRRCLVFFLFDLAGQAFEGYVSLQKSLLDLTVEQSTAVVDAAKVCSHDASKAKAEVTNVIQQSVDRTVVAQNSVLDFAAKQAKAMNEAVKQQPGVTGTPVEAVTDSVQRGVDTVVATQKEFLKLATKSLKSTAAKA